MTSERKAVKEISSIEELKREAQQVAKKTLPPEQIERYFGAVVESDKRSREVLDRIFFKQKIIHDIAPSTETKFLGHTLKTPIMIAPMASMATMFEDGIGKMCTATNETGSMPWVAFYSKEYYGKHVKTNPIVFIMKPIADREKLLKELMIAEQEGCVALGIDVDSGGDTSRGGAGRWGAEKPLSLDELKKIRGSVSKPFIVKGVLSVDDAVKAVEVGANAIVVSNHYGTKLDFALATLEVLPDIVEAVGDRVEILVDCQIRKGSDVLKVLAMGGKAVLVGRPIVWGAWVGGAEGMARLIQLMTEELRHAMLYTGVESAAKVPKDILVLPKEIFG